MTSQFPSTVRDEVGEATLELFRENDGYSAFLWRSLAALGGAPIGPRVLEVGCGIGNLTRLLLADSNVRYVHAIDLDPTYVARVREAVQDPRLELSDAAAEDFCPPPFVEEDGNFDTIVCINVLEHIEDHERVLRNFASMLRPGGHALILVPAHPFLYSGLDRNLSHFRRYARRDFATLAAATGLRLTRQRHFNPLGAFGWWLNGKILRRDMLPAAQLSAYARFAIPLSRLLDRLNPLPLGVSLLVVLSRREGELDSRPAVEG